jgi:hypothetical protein
MKTSSIFSILALFLALTYSACGGSHSHGNGNTENAAEATESVDQSGPEYTSAYICPMHCTGSGSDKPGTCPVCGMDYVVNEGDDQSHDGHDHSH